LSITLAVPSPGASLASHSSAKFKATIVSQGRASTFFPLYHLDCTPAIASWGKAAQRRDSLPYVTSRNARQELTLKAWQLLLDKALALSSSLPWQPCFASRRHVCRLSLGDGLTAIVDRKPDANRSSSHCLTDSNCSR